MPHQLIIENFEDPDYDNEFGLMTREVYDAGDYYYVNDLIALLGGDAGTVVTPTTETTPVASFSNELKEAYLAKINSITLDDFTDENYIYPPNAGEINVKTLALKDRDGGYAVYPVTS